MARPSQLPSRPPLSPEEIKAANYLGSGEHKDVRWWGGLPLAPRNSKGVRVRPGKQLTTICPLTTEAERDMASGWVRYALANRQFRYYEGDGRYPKHIWYREESGQAWFGFLVNDAAYKGWPVDEDEIVENFG